MRYVQPTYLIFTTRSPESNPESSPGFITSPLLHRELRDYSLGQIAFAVFRALFAITQLLCHVSALLTSACKQA